MREVVRVYPCGCRSGPQSATCEEMEELYAHRGVIEHKVREGELPQETLEEIMAAMLRHYEFEEQERADTHLPLVSGVVKEVRTPKSREDIEALRKMYEKTKGKER